MEKNTILVVDDEAILRLSAQLLLIREGYKVILAKDGLEGVQKYEENQQDISVVLLDKSLPKLSGEQVLEKILEMNSEAKVVLVSGYNLKYENNRFKSKLYGILQKPFDPAELLSAVKV